jgi:hypothetical protein
MDDIRPVIYVWTEDGVMKPLERFNGLCDRQYVVGVEYRLAVEEDRSMAQHRRYFACIREAWRNLPENIASSFTSPEALRKWVLIKLGYANEQAIVCDSISDTIRFKHYLDQKRDDSIVVRKGRVVVIYTAISQSVRHMDKAKFKETSDAVLDYIAGMIGTSVADLASNADQAA